MSATDTIQNVPPAMLASATYDISTKSAVLKFYEPVSQRIILWPDATGHRPYCYSRMSPGELRAELGERRDVLDIIPTTLKDLAADRTVTFSKIVVDDPLAIGGTSGNKSIRNVLADTWESDIKYYENYLYDRGLVVGKHYSIRGSTIRPQDKALSENVQQSLKSLLWDRAGGEQVVDADQFREFTSEWASLLNQPIPEIKRMALDIEVDSQQGRIPDARLAENTITAVGFAGTGNFKKIFVLDDARTQKGINELEPDVEVVFYTDEKSMIRDTFKIILDFPFVITYNGDEFDIPYLYNRAERLGIPDGENPLRMMKNSATLRKGVHLDLYRTMSNRAFQIYVFSQKYTNFSLNSVSKALLGEQKIDYGKDLGNLTLYETANYCYNDARLTLKLTTFGNDLLMNLLIIISRIGRMPIDDIARMGVSQWIRSLLYYEHRRMGAIIPNPKELSKRTAEVSADAVIKNKKYRGGLVMDPIEGVHFSVTVMDFASLYPSIIKVRNLSYETVRCPHAECHTNTIHQTNHWVCRKRNGITSMIIGSLRDLRVNYYKTLSKSPALDEAQRQQYAVIAQALKVILNASYGVMGAEIFPLYYLPAAEATTAVGRHTIERTVQMCKERGITVLYGDTDSLFLKNPTGDQIKLVMEWAKREHGVDLEVDKVYRYCVLSNRKKNYFGVTESGKVDIKGLLGKKSNTPVFVKKLFEDVILILSKVQNMDEFEKAKKEISDLIYRGAQQIENRDVPIDQLAFNIMMSKSPSEYTKTVPQHVRAAKMLEQETGQEIKRGDIISFIKTKAKLGVKPVSMAKPAEADPVKYVECMESTLDQIVSSMNLDFDTVLGKPKQTGLDQFFWG